MIPHGLIIDRIQKLAVDIINAYDLRESGIRITMLCILKGGHQFFSDLCNVLKQLTLTKCKQPPLTFDFIRVKSYAGTESSGAENTKIESIGVDLKALAGRHVLLVEDIIDTGNTMSMLVPYLKSFGPTTVRVATLLQKRTPKSCGFMGDFVGFTIPDKVRVALRPGSPAPRGSHRTDQTSCPRAAALQFVVGYCLDYNEVFRDMAHICIMNPSGIKRHANAK